MVKSHDIHIDVEYAEWIAELKHRYRSAQVKAAVKVNAEKLLFNWQLGRDLVQKKAEERWGAGVVEQVSKAHLYEHQGKIVNNFSDHLPDVQSRLVQEVLKENYDFSFATVEHDPYEERELEDALTEDVTNLLLEMGTGFAFVGRQKEFVVGGRSRKIDLLF